MFEVIIDCAPSGLISVMLCNVMSYLIVVSVFGDPCFLTSTFRKDAGITTDPLDFARSVPVTV